MIWNSRICNGILERLANFLWISLGVKMFSTDFLLGVRMKDTIRPVLYRLGRWGGGGGEKCRY